MRMAPPRTGLRRAATRLAERCAALPADDLGSGAAAVSQNILGAMLELATWLIRIETAPDGALHAASAAILVFVPGIAAVEELAA